MRLITIALLFSFVSAFSQVSTYGITNVSGTNTYVANPVQSLVLQDGAKLWARFANENTSGTVTLNVSSKGAKSLTDAAGNNPEIGDIKAGSVWQITYDATADKWKLMGGYGSGTSLTDGNGTTYNSGIGAVDLGGFITRSYTTIDIDYDFSNEKKFSIRNYASSDTTSYSGFITDTEFGGLTSYLIGQNSPTIYSKLLTGVNAGVGISSINSSENFDLTFDAQVKKAIFTDNRTIKKGIQYAASGYETDDLSLISYGFAKNNFAYSLFDDYTDASNSSTTETDLYSHSIAANTLSANGNKLEVVFGGSFVTTTANAASTNNKLAMYFAGTKIFDPSGGFTVSTIDSWNIRATLIRSSSSVIRCNIVFTTQGTLVNATIDVTSVNFTTSNILKITGQGAASNFITAKIGNITFKK